MTARVVIDPPKTEDGRFLYQEECCYNLCPEWQVPARALHIASDIDGAYVPPLDSWELFAAAVESYEAVWMLYTFPLSQFLAVPERLRSKIFAVTNPHQCSSNIDAAGFKGITSTIGFGLNVDERFWFLYDNQPATIQVNSGCPYQCEYCVWSRQAFPRRQWANPVVCGQLSSLARAPYLICSQITGEPQWVAAFIGARTQPFNAFSTDLNCAHLPNFTEDIRALAEVGMSRAIVGIEAMAPNSLRRLGCAHTIGQARAMFGLLTELGVEGVFQLRYGYGETIEEIEESTRALAAVAEDFPGATDLHEIRAGAIYYWFESDLSRSLTLRTVAPLGYPVSVEAGTPERREAWLAAYETLRAAGWTVR